MGGWDRTNQLSVGGASGNSHPGHPSKGISNMTDKPDFVVTPVDGIEVFINVNGQIAIKQQGLYDCAIVVFEKAHADLIICRLRELRDE